MEKQKTLLEELLQLYLDTTINYGTYCYLRDLATKTIEAAKLENRKEKRWLPQLIHELPEPLWQKWKNYCREQLNTIPELEDYDNFMKLK